MISIEIKGKRFDLSQNVSFAIKSENPFLVNDYIPGPVVYSVSGVISSQNRIITEYADQLSNAKRKLVFENVLVYIGGQVWREGIMKLKKASSSGYNFSFYSDAGDAKSRIENKRLPDLVLEEGVTVDDQSADYFPTAKHVFFPVYNPDFYGNKNTDYLGYMNYFHAGTFGVNVATNAHVKVPFIYALYVLQECFKEMGYSQISGAIFEDEDAQRQIIFNTNSLDLLNGSGINVMKTTFDYVDHLPDITISDFVIDTCIVLGVTPIFNSLAKSVNLVSLQSFMGDVSAKDYTNRASEEYEITPNEYDGVNFVMRADSRDKSLEENSDWLEYKVGNGKENLDTMASTLQMALNLADSINSKTWTVPQVLQQGNSAPFELNNRQRALRFLYFTGNGTDSASNNYPLGHWQGITTDLRWEGFKGLVEKRYKTWLAFKAITETVEFDLDIELIDLLNFDFAKKINAYYLRFIVEEYSTTIKNDGLDTLRIVAKTF